MLFFKPKEKLNIDSLQALFSAQKKTLIDFGYPTMLGMSVEDFNNQLDNLWKTLSQKVATMQITKKGNVSLLIVVNAGNLQEKIQKIKGHSELELKNITNQPQESMFSLLLDVEDGHSMVAKSPRDALKKFEKEKRSALTINESIALLTHYPHLLKDHYLISVGSFYPKEGEELPLLWLLDEHKNPELHYAWFHIAHGSYGAASYSIKL